MAPLTSVQRRRLRTLLLAGGERDTLLRLGEMCSTFARRGYRLEDLLIEDGLEDLHFEQLAEAVATYRKHRQGFLYLAVNAAYAPGLHKIGASRVSPEGRRQSLRTAGVPGRFVLVKSWPVPDAFAAETSCREALHDRRVERDFYAGHYAELTTFLDQVVAHEYEVGKRLGFSDFSCTTLSSQP